ncbi:hypothetical protein JCM10450v2_003851 [Rhodotorula kratochvilovae]
MAASASTKPVKKRSTDKGADAPRKRPRKVAPPASSDDDEASDPAVEVLDSDASSDGPKMKAKAKGKARAKSEDGGKKPKGKAKGKERDEGKKKAPRKKRASKKEDEDDFIDDGAEEDEADATDDSDGGLNTRVVREVKKVAAPKVNAETSLILPETLDFLAQLAKNNDRDWFQQHDALYRHAHLNFKTFLAAWVPVASEADWSLPHLPVKDLEHRIYRDVRFSKDKTPYKRYLCASHSRTGRKGPFALYYVHIQPGGKSFLGCGCWSPGSDVLKLLRAQILSDPKPLRKILAKKEFVELFGEPKPRMDGKRTSVFGGDDQLKNAPKLEGVDKTHRDIDLLKCRSFAVETHFADDVVTSPEFLDKLKHAMSVASEFAQYLNEIIAPTPPSEDEDEDGEDGSGGEDEGSEPEEAEEDEEE